MVLGCFLNPRPLSPLIAHFPCTNNYSHLYISFRKHFYQTHTYIQYCLLTYRRNFSYAIPLNFPSLGLNDWDIQLSCCKDFIKWKILFANLCGVSRYWLVGSGSQFQFCMHACFLLVMSLSAYNLIFTTLSLICLWFYQAPI